MRGRSSRLASWSLGAALLAASPTTAQVERTPQGESTRIGGTGDRYKDYYGEPEFRDLDNDEAWPWPAKRAIRTIGVLQEIPNSRYRAGDRPGPPRYQICGERRCLEIQPVDEVRAACVANFPFWTYRQIEVVGAYAGGEQVGPAAAPPGFGIWQVLLLPESRGKPTHASSLEGLVRYPAGAAGRTVTVNGTFRGANLFGDLPKESRRDDGDWVLRDGPFSIWITGRPAKGKGWSLDASSRADCDWRLEVTGVVETAGGYVYLRAKNLGLLRRERSEVARP
jgi:hypothetical protein